jgi:diadenosine tetraphosphate (Ap4A) HIT family hydrolase
MTNQPCPLCVQEDVVLRNALAYVRHDNFALSRGHVLVVPVRHVADFFDMTTEEMHVHLIPRYHGDVTDPRGGIRCVLSRETHK